MNQEEHETSTEEARLWRKEQRARLLAARIAMPAAAHKAACASITRILSEELLSALKPKVVGAFWPIRGEFDCRPLLNLLSGQGVGLALPVVLGKAAPLGFRAWAPGDVLENGPMNIPQPSKAASVIPDCLLIPVVGFDAHNYRLGYGAGHYDRTLAGMDTKPVTIGVGFECQRIDDIRPHGFDIALDYVVTEAGIQVHDAIPPRAQRGEGDRP